jgi:hypothetical protein
MSETFGGTFEESAGMQSEEGDGTLMVNLGDVDEKGNFQAAPRGLYDCVVAQLDFALSQSSGNPMWTWVFEVEDTNAEFKGRKFFYHTVFNEGGMPRVKRTLARIKTDDGYEAHLLSNRFSPETVANEGRLLGARCRVRIEQRKYDGRMTNNVKDVLPPTGGGGEAGGFGNV